MIQKNFESAFGVVSPFLLLRLRLTEFLLAMFLDLAEQGRSRLVGWLVGWLVGRLLPLSVAQHSQA
ncbi:hypothetical protein [Pseudomonas sp. S8]|uniref:hypothetical protein n=1 Tax=Pseudomonas sp. S8 TaxID=211136 RepID=UPI003D27B893